MIRRRLFAGFAALALLALGQSAQAGFNNFNGGIPLNVAGVVTDTGNIDTATQFILGPTYYLGSGATGDFATYLNPIASPFLQVGAASSISGLNPNAVDNVLMNFAPGGGWTFGNSTFGMFTAVEYEAIASATQTQSYVFLGNFTTGTAFASDPNAGTGSASITLTFSQNAGPGTPISGSGTMNVPPTVVPEPASAVMLGLGLVSLGGLAVRRRMAK
jgi:hypothetical protein